MATLDGCDKPTTSKAPHPFNDPKADFIIRSSDNVLFYIHKSLLSIVSPVFEKMLTLPQETYDDRPCLTVDDDKRHLLCLLSWCDRRSNELKPTIDDLTRMLSISKKYRVDLMFANAQKDLVAHLFPLESLRVYAIAIRFQLGTIAQLAAQETLQLSLASHSSLCLAHISAPAIQNLHNYHFNCKEALRDLLASELWADKMRAATQHLGSDQEGLHTHGLEYFKLKKLTIVGGRALWVSTGGTAPWWVAYMEAIMYIINERPSLRPLSYLSLKWIKKSISLGECRQCRKQGYERLEAVSRCLVKIIDETISKVPFQVKY